MSTMSYRPPIVDDLVRQIEKHVGETPEVVVIGHHVWEIRLVGEHVLATGGYWVRPMDGKVKFIPGHFYVDGQERKAAGDLGQLRAMWDRYEKGIIEEPPALPEWTGDLDEVPQIVSRIYQELHKLEEERRGQEGAFIARLGFEDGHWFAGADTPPDTPQAASGCIRIAYTQAEENDAIWVPDPRYSVFIADGIRSRPKTIAEMNKLIQAMVNAQRARPASSSNGPISHGHTAVPGKANSVSVRRATVVRV